MRGALYIGIPDSGRVEVDLTTANPTPDEWREASRTLATFHKLAKGRRS